MCKLCNRNTEPSKANYTALIKLRLQQVVLEYTGELPCHSCLVSLTSSYTQGIVTLDSIDLYVLRKLYKTHYLKFITRTSKKAIYNSLIKDNTTVRNILGIRIITNNTKKSTYYSATVHNTNNRKVVGNYNTLTEALEA